MKIKKDGKEVEIELKNPKGRHTKKGFELLTKFQTKKGTEDLKNYLTYVDEMASEISGMSIKELDDLEKPEKDKIRKYCADKINEEADFLRSSLKQESSGPKETEESSKLCLSEEEPGTDGKTK